MLSFLKRAFRKLKEMGYGVRASGGTYWLGLIPVFALWTFKAPAILIAIAIVLLSIWVFISLCTVIPDNWLIVKPKAKKGRLFNKKR